MCVYACVRERERERERERPKFTNFRCPILNFRVFGFCPIPDFSKPAQKKSATNFFLIIRFFVGFETLAAFSFHLR